MVTSSAVIAPTATGTPNRSPGAPPERQSDFYEGAIGADGELVTFFVPNIGGEDVRPAGCRCRVRGDHRRRGRSSPPMPPREVSSTGSAPFAIRQGDSVFITALPLNDVESTVTRLIWVELLGVASILAVLGSGDLVDDPPRHQADQADDDHGHRDRCRRPVGADRRIVAGGGVARARRRAEHDARHDPRRTRRAGRIREPPATIRLGRVARTPYAGDDDPRIRRAVPARRSRPNPVRSTTRCAAPRRSRCGCRGSWRTCCCSRSSTSNGRSTAAPSTWPSSRCDAGADARVVAPDRSITVEAGVPTVVSGDDDRLRQVFANLVGNAIAHTDHGASITIRVVRR